MNEEVNYKSSAKFLITAEYLILKGAKGLALPLKPTQILSIKNNLTNNIIWTSKVFDKTWFSATFSILDFSVLETSNIEIANALQNIFKEVRILNHHFIKVGVDATILADFNLEWGLGSSSTLINNIAKWGKVNPYQLLEKTFRGSGYDIACADAKGPITYQLKGKECIVEEVGFNPVFYENIFFVYLGKKMNSRAGMSLFKEKGAYTDKDIEHVNYITDLLINCNNLSIFELYLNVHEEILAKILKTTTIKNSKFLDYPHTIKSMGAWGGDFVLVTGESLDQVKKYFNAKGLDTVIKYKDIVLS